MRCGAENRKIFEIKGLRRKIQKTKEIAPAPMIQFRYKLSEYGLARWVLKSMITLEKLRAD